MYKIKRKDIIVQNKYQNKNIDNDKQWLLMLIFLNLQNHTNPNVIIYKHIECVWK